MTNQEAIKMLKSKMDGHTDTSYEWAETVRMAIKALEQEPFMNKPCVSNQVCHEDKVKVLDKIRAEIEPKCDRINSIASVLPYTAHREIQELLCEIMDLPSVEQEPKESEG